MVYLADAALAIARKRRQGPDQRPVRIEDSRTAELLDAIAEVDLDQLDIEPPRGFGQD